MTEKYKIINKTFAPLQFTKVGVVPARGFIIVNEVPKEIRVFQKRNMIDIKKISV